MDIRRVRKLAGQYLLPALAIFAVASCCGSKLPDAAAGNVAPVAVLSAAMAASQTPDVVGDAPLAVALDASGSFDPDGTIVTFDWDFETDGTYDLFDGGATTTHIYEVAGLYTATVRVTDNGGLTATASALISVGVETPPEAAGTGQVNPENPLDVVYDATSSFDLDGEIVQYDWDMDDDGTFEIIDGGPNPSHEFPDYGTFTVNVRVTDDDGNTDTGEIVVILTPEGNLPPSAVLSATPDSGVAPGLEVLYDASLSTDPDGTIVSFDWDMDNDGTFEITAGGATQNTTYDVDGAYTVGVQVTDDAGATDTASVQVLVGAIVAPTAVLTATPDTGFAPGLEVVFDASGSFDPDGTIVSYDWDMNNDGAFELYGGGVQQNLTYDVDGFFTARVRVTDNHGATDIAEASVAVGSIVPPTAVLTATPDSGDATLDVVFDGTASSDPDGTIVSYDWDMDNDGTFEVINSTATQGMSYTAGGSYTVVLRVTDNDGATDTASVTVEVNDPPQADLVVEPYSQQETSRSTSAITGIPGEFIYDASGSTDSDGTIVSYDWDMDNDGTFEILDGTVTQYAYYYESGLHTVTVRVTDNDGATDTASEGVDINIPPFAILEVSPVAGQAPLDATFDASASTDSDGTIVSYDWDMDNDGTYEILNGTVTQPASYTSDGIYVVIVRVTDNDGAFGYASTSVTVFTPPTAVLTGEFDGEWQIFWDASASFDGGTGTIVQYDWDTNNDGTFDTLDYGPLYTQEDVGYYEEHIFGVRVTDNDGLTDTAYFTVNTDYGDN